MPRRRSWKAAASPAGPPPMMATFLPISAAPGSNLKPWVKAASPMYCSTALMPTKSSTSLRLQPS
jgi:hypothetical protein